jgi:hypothetical protein
MSDYFQRPCPFRPDIVVDITSYVDTVVQMLACHESQVFDWLPYNRGESAQVPQDPDERRRWLKDWYLEMIQPLTSRHREQVMESFGADAGDRVRYIEAFETCEYGTPLSDEGRRRLFPFLP